MSIPYTLGLARLHETNIVFSAGAHAYSIKNTAAIFIAIAHSSGGGVRTMGPFWVAGHIRPGPASGRGRAARFPGMASARALRQFLVPDSSDSQRRANFVRSSEA